MHAPRTLSVLVVDDDSDTVETTVMLLELHGFHARGAVGGDVAVAEAADPPDVALIDIAMPKVDGYEVARRIKRSCVSKPPVLIAVTGMSSEWDQGRAHAAGFALYLIKPVVPHELITIIQQCQRARE